jgi:hypothetical protein
MVQDLHVVLGAGPGTASLAFLDEQMRLGLQRLPNGQQIAALQVAWRKTGAEAVRAKETKVGLAITNAASRCQDWGWLTLAPGFE